MTDVVGTAYVIQEHTLKALAEKFDFPFDNLEADTKARIIGSFVIELPGVDPFIFNEETLKVHFDFDRELIKSSDFFAIRPDPNSQYIKQILEE